VINELNREEVCRLMSKVDEFRRLIPNEFNGGLLETVKWSGSGRRSNNLLKIKTSSSSIILYVKEFNKLPGFWGLTKNQLDRIEKFQICWFTVLLLRSNDTGYIITSNDVKERIQNGTFELSRDGDYKINERTDLSSNMSFCGIQELLHRVLLCNTTNSP
jgi:hypothetical protein